MATCTTLTERPRGRLYRAAAKSHITCFHLQLRHTASASATLQITLLDDLWNGDPCPIFLGAFALGHTQGRWTIRFHGARGARQRFMRALLYRHTRTNFAYISAGGRSRRANVQWITSVQTLRYPPIYIRCHRRSVRAFNSNVYASDSPARLLTAAYRNTPTDMVTHTITWVTCELAFAALSCDCHSDS